MHYRFHRILMLVLLSFMIVSCATKPVINAPDSEHLATAKRFLHSWGAGEVAMIKFQSTLEANAKEQPGLTELARRAFGDVTVTAPTWSGG